jgi:hypothetical protein
MARKSKRWSQRAELKLRLPEALRYSLEYAAKERGDSMNSEIVKRLTASFQFYKDSDPATKVVARSLLTWLPDDVVNEMVETVNRVEAEEAMADEAKERWEEWQREEESK